MRIIIQIKYSQWIQLVVNFKKKNDNFASMVNTPLASERLLKKKNKSTCDQIIADTFFEIEVDNKAKKIMTHQRSYSTCSN